ncbi:MAG: hypothetical protein ACREDR_39130 [Blastocatellia bacterium]
MSGNGEDHQPQSPQSTDSEPQSSEGRGATSSQEGAMPFPVPKAETNWSAVGGFVLAIPLQLLQVPLLLIAPVLGPFFGVTQLVYIIPAIVMARRSGLPKLGLGIAIGAAVVLLMNATCFGLLFHGGSF